MDEGASRTLVVIHPGSLGDVILSLPALRGLRVAFPRHELIFLAGGEVGLLLKEAGEVDRVFPLERHVLADLLQEPEALNEDLKSYLASCDVAVCWMRHGESHIKAVLSRLGVARAIIMSPHASGLTSLHQSDRFCETVRDVAVAPDRPVPLRLPHKTVAEGVRYLESLGGSPGRPPRRPIVLLHPGSGSRLKCCEPGLFVEALSHLRERDATPVLLQGPADEEQVTQVLRRWAKPLPVLKDLPLGLVAGVIAEADLYVGHDSGLTHLAAALAVPTVALFGPTDVPRWAPRGQNVIPLRGVTCACEEWETVRACRDKPCLRIPVQALMEACELLLAQDGRGVSR